MDQFLALVALQKNDIERVILLNTLHGGKLKQLCGHLTEEGTEYPLVKEKCVEYIVKKLQSNKDS